MGTKVMTAECAADLADATVTTWAPAGKWVVFARIDIDDIVCEVFKHRSRAIRKWHQLQRTRFAMSATCEFEVETVNGIEFFTVTDQNGTELSVG